MLSQSQALDEARHLLGDSSLTVEVALCRLTAARRAGVSLSGKAAEIVEALAPEAKPAFWWEAVDGTRVVKGRVLGWDGLRGIGWEKFPPKAKITMRAAHPLLFDIVTITATVPARDYTIYTFYLRYLRMFAGFSDPGEQAVSERTWIARSKTFEAAGVERVARRFLALAGMPDR